MNSDLSFHALLAILGLHPPVGNGTHAHKCPNCGHAWRHADSCAGDPQAHTCQKCSTEVWFRHYGEASSA